MHVVFGLGCDGPTCPDFPGAEEGALNSAVVGPAGLIDALELQLGLTAPREVGSVRIAAYAARLQAALGVDPTMFFAGSFTRDPWATARALLTQRDQLRLAGWSGSAVGAPRPDTLALIERDPPPLGFADRLRAVIEALAERPRLPLRSVDLVEPEFLLPPVWRRLVAALRDCNVTVAAANIEARSAKESDLAALHRFIAGSASEALEGDGSVALLEADTTLMAAEALARLRGFACGKVDFGGCRVR